MSILIQYKNVTLAHEVALVFKQLSEADFVVELECAETKGFDCEPEAEEHERRHGSEGDG